MNNLNDDFERMKMNSNDLENVPPPPPSPIVEHQTSTLSNTSDLIDIVNNVYIHMEVKNRTNPNKLNSHDSSKEFDDSLQSNDFFKLLEPNIQGSNENVLNKENFIKLLRTYKAYLDANSIGKARKQMKSFKNQYSLEDEEDAMDTENKYEFNNDHNVNDNKEILYEIKSFIRNNKFKTESDEYMDSAFDDNQELTDESNDENDDEDDILPRNLIVTSIPIEVFNDFDMKLKFETTFTEIDAKCNFCYFRLFKRCCIQYQDSISAVLARFELDNLMFLNERLKIFLTRVIMVFYLLRNKI